jgi:hypothetical protein
MHAAVISLVFAAMAGAVVDPPEPSAPPAAPAAEPARPSSPAMERAQPDAALALGAKDIPIEILEQALAPAPRVVILRTAYYGTITVNHAAHLARKIHCIECHGQGPVAHIEFTPKIAHERCRNCHAEAKRGPTECRGCHNMVAPGTLITGMRAIGAPQVTAAQAKALSEAKAAEDARRYAGAGAVPTAAELHAFAEAPRSTPFRHTLEVGGAAGDGYGFLARVSSRRDWFEVSSSLNRLTGPGRARSLLLVGAGAWFPTQTTPTLGFTTELVGGLDAVQRPSVKLSAAGGARVGMEWTPDWTPRLPIRLAVAGLVDLFRDGVASPATAWVTLGVGAPVGSQ